MKKYDHKKELNVTQYACALIFIIIIIYMIYHDDFDTTTVTKAVKGGLIKGAMSTILFAPATGYVMYPVFSGLMMGVYEGMKVYMGT